MRHPADSHTFEDGKVLRLVNDSVLVKLDPDQDKSLTGLIHFPEGSMQHIYSTGTVLAFGWVKEKKLADTTRTKPYKVPFPVPGLEAGLKCCFIRFRREQDSNKCLRQMYGDDIISLKAEDILFVFTGELELG